MLVFVESWNITDTLIVWCVHVNTLTMNTLLTVSAFGLRVWQARKDRWSSQWSDQIYFCFTLITHQPTVSHLCTQCNCCLCVWVYYLKQLLLDDQQLRLKCYIFSTESDVIFFFIHFSSFMASSGERVINCCFVRSLLHEVWSLLHEKTKVHLFILFHASTVNWFASVIAASLSHTPHTCDV